MDSGCRGVLFGHARPGVEAGSRISTRSPEFLPLPNTAAADSPEHRSPAFIGMGGAIGFTPQKTRGMAALLVIMGAVFLLWMIILLTL